MSDVGYVSLYVNTVAIMLCLGVHVLVWKFKMKDIREKRVFLYLLGDIVVMSLFYILCTFRDDGVIPCNKLGAMFLETGLEMAINIFALIWFLYVDYRMFHSVGHIKRNAVVIMVPLLLAVLMNIINIPTKFLFDYDMSEMHVVETSFYVFLDVIRLAYFIVSIIILVIRKRKDERMKFFSIGAFIIPSVFYVFLYYFTPFPTVSLGLTIAVTLLYAEMVNEKCYQDEKTGFYNMLYLDYLKKRIAENKYDLRSILMFNVPESEMEKSSPLITKQLPEFCDTIRCGKDKLIILSRVKDKGPLTMLSEDVKMSLEEAGIAVESSFKLKKKNETAESFLEDFMRNA